MIDFKKLNVVKEQTIKVGTLSKLKEHYNTFCASREEAEKSVIANHATYCCDMPTISLSEQLQKLLDEKGVPEYGALGQVFYVSLSWISQEQVDAEYESLRKTTDPEVLEKFGKSSAGLRLSIVSEYVHIRPDSYFEEMEKRDLEDKQLTSK